MEEGTCRVIRLRLRQPDELFQLPQTDLFSEDRNFLTGVDYCISELRSRRSRIPVRLVLELPQSEIDEDSTRRIKQTLTRYCDHRLKYNAREQRALRLDGLSSLRFGLPIAVLGLLIAVGAGRAFGSSGNTGIVLDTAGWVLTWVGLWYPLDTLVFTPLGYGRENRVLRLLRDADVIVEPSQLATA